MVELINDANNGPSLSSPSSVSCLQINLQHCRFACHNLELKLSNKSATVVFIQEPYLVKGIPCLLPKGMEKNLR